MRGGVVAAVRGVVLALVLSVSAATLAESNSSLVDALLNNSDFQVRTSAAVSLGSSGDKSARPHLEKALNNDSHPAVRGAAAAALGALGDSSAIPALDRAAKNDDSASVRSVAKTASQKLSSASSSSAKAKLLVQLGQMKNGSSTTDRDLAVPLRDATRNEVAKLSGVEVIADSADAKSVATQRKLPVIVLDGTVTKVSTSGSGSSTTMATSIEYVVKKDGSLKGTATGSAQAQGEVPESPATAKALALRELQDQSIGGAVQSALRGASSALMKAGN